MCPRVLSCPLSLPFQQVIPHRCPEPSSGSFWLFPFLTSGTQDISTAVTSTVRTPETPTALSTDAGPCLIRTPPTLYCPLASIPALGFKDTVLICKSQVKSCLSPASPNTGPLLTVPTEHTTCWCSPFSFSAGLPATHRGQLTPTQASARGPRPPQALISPVSSLCRHPDSLKPSCCLPTPYFSWFCFLSRLIDD